MKFSVPLLDKVELIFKVLYRVILQSIISWLPEAKTNIKIHRTYLEIPFAGEQILVPYRTGLRSRQYDFAFNTIDYQGNVRELKAVPGIPFLISPNDLGVEKIQRINLNDETEVFFVGDQIPHFEDIS